jgi:hypothetical protein
MLIYVGGLMTWIGTTCICIFKMIRVALVGSSCICRVKLSYEVDVDVD